MFKNNTDIHFFWRHSKQGGLFFFFLFSFFLLFFLNINFLYMFFFLREMNGFYHLKLFMIPSMQLSRAIWICKSPWLFVCHMDIENIRRSSEMGLGRKAKWLKGHFRLMSRLGFYASVIWSSFGIIKILLDWGIFIFRIISLFS